MTDRGRAFQRLNKCSKNLNIAVGSSKWMTDSRQLLTFLSYIDFIVAIDLEEIEKNSTDETLTNLIKNRIKFKLLTILDKIGD